MGDATGSLEAVPQLPTPPSAISSLTPVSSMPRTSAASSTPAAAQRAGPCRATGAVRHQSHGGHPIPSRSGKDSFVHFSSIDGDGYRALNDGARGSYQSEAGPKGPVATNVSELSG